MPQPRRYRNKNISMKKIVLSLVCIMIGFRLLAQVGVGTTMPQGAFDVVSSDSGFLFPRVANTAAVTAPVNGMIIYDVSSECFKGYQAGAWTPCGFATIVLEEGEVLSPTGKIWMDKNLGASRVATSSTDASSFGDLYQWGRRADGHQLRSSATTAALASSSTPGHGEFIVCDSCDWLASSDDTLWQGVDGTNNPCPTGFRLPTEAEWEAERISWDTNDAAGAYASVLKLPRCGQRWYDGEIFDNYGGYWSSTIASQEGVSRLLRIQSNYAWIMSGGRAQGDAVRCVKD